MQHDYETSHKVKNMRDLLQKQETETVSLTNAFCRERNQKKVQKGLNVGSIKRA